MLSFYVSGGLEIHCGKTETSSWKSHPLAQRFPKKFPVILCHKLDITKLIIKNVGTQLLIEKMLHTRFE